MLNSVCLCSLSNVKKEDKGYKLLVFGHRSLIKNIKETVDVSNGNSVNGGTIKILSQQSKSFSLLTLAFNCGCNS